MCACGTVRKTTQTTTHSERTDSVQTHESNQQRATETEVTTAESGVIISQVVELFDTDQPADPATGTPPLKQRIVTHTQKNTHITTEAARASEAASVAITTATTHETAAEQTTTDETPQHGKFGIVLRLVVVLVVLVAILIFLLRKQIKNLLNPF